MSKLDAFFIDLAHRLIASYKTSFIGLLLTVGSFVLPQLQASSNPYLHYLAMAAAVPFFLIRDQQVKNGVIVKTLAILLFVGGLSACGFIRKEEGATFGGDELACIKNVPADVVQKAEAALAGPAADPVDVAKSVVAQVGLDLAKCVFTVAIADFKAAHAQAVADAGTPTPSPEMRSLLEMQVDTDPYPAAIAHAQLALDYLKAR